MICTAEQAIAAMEYWLGYYEKASSKYAAYRDKKYFELDKGSGNYTYPGYYCGIQGGAWCAMLVSTALAEACGSKADAKTVMHGVWPYSSCNQLYDAAPSGYKGKRGSWTPKPGDVIVFTSNGSTRSHTGMVYKVEDGKVYTIEGNVSNMCKRKSYKLTDTYIYGYVRPKYSNSSGGDTKVSCTIKGYILKVGSKGTGVRTLQAALNALGYSAGYTDGEFGSKTEKAVKAFQQAYGLTADGEVGPNTWAKLLAI